MSYLSGTRVKVYYIYGDPRPDMTKKSPFTTRRRFSAKADRPDLLRGRTPEEFLETAYGYTKTRLIGSLLHQGSVLIRGWRFDFREHLSQFKAMKGGVEHSVYAPSKESLNWQGFTDIKKQ